MDTTTEFKLIKKSVNSKDLFNNISEFVEDGIITGGILWGNEIHRSSFVDVIGDLLEEEMNENKIDQWNVICDLRNNTISEMNKGIYVLEVLYRQKHCLNTTRLIYTIKDLLVSNIRDLLEFHK